MTNDAGGDWSPYSATTIDRARSRFYPGWWTHSGVERPVDKLPHYRVYCLSEGERRLAQAAKPSCVAVEYVVESPYPRGGRF